ncbi:hypothetical protein GJ496_007303 [Pomphorhynchus laevis]|nr:hypothetical protein GJ496_007303 [Pomphorhynchus laevis]
MIKSSQNQNYYKSFTTDYRVARNRRKVFVGMLGPTTNAKLLKRIFGKIGKVESAYILHNNQKGSTLCGFVIFDNEKSAFRAVTEMHNAIWLPGAKLPINVFPATQETKQMHVRSNKSLDSILQRIKCLNDFLALRRKNICMGEPLSEMYLEFCRNHGETLKIDLLAFRNPS